MTEQFDLIHGQIADINNQIVDRYICDDKFENYEQLKYRFLSNDFLNDKKFIIGTNIHKNLKIRHIYSHVPFQCGSPGVGKIQHYIIHCPKLFYKRGFCNLRCSYQHTIDSIELIRCYESGKEQKISKIWNPNGSGVIFQQLRQLYKISDPSIVPLITEKMVPFLENSDYTINIRYNHSDDLNDINDIKLSYEVVELDETMFASFQYALDLHTILDNNQAHEEIKTIIDQFDYVTPRLEYTGSEVISNRNSTYNLNFDGYLQSMLIYTPNNAVLSAVCEVIVDRYNHFILPAKIDYNGGYTLMNFIPSDEVELSQIKRYGVHTSLSTMFMRLHLEVKKYGLSYTAEIFAICHKINRITQGNWLQI